MLLTHYGVAGCQLALVMAAAHTLGEIALLMLRVRDLDRAERICLRLALGMGLLGTLSFGLGAAGFARGDVFTGVLLVLGLPAAGRWALGVGR
jgi:hypothetical protein